MTSRILFDASSTDATSPVLYVAPESCILLNAWNLGMDEVAQVFRLLMLPGSVPTDVNGSSCSPMPRVTPADILQEAAYLPCSGPVQLGQTATQNLTSIVLSQPGYYNLHLTPAALGTAVIEAVFLTGAAACGQAAAACCCPPPPVVVDGGGGGGGS